MTKPHLLRMTLGWELVRRGWQFSKGLYQERLHSPRGAGFTVVLEGGMLYAVPDTVDFKSLAANDK